MGIVGKTPRIGMTSIPKTFSEEESLLYTERCPRCSDGVGVKAMEHLEFDSKEGFVNVYECPLCTQLILRLFRKDTSTFKEYNLVSTYPSKKAITYFNDDINNISEDFVIIYNESEIAENNSLLNICGPGYRKALEFLIKDYIIKKHPKKESEVKNKFLGRCINDDIDDIRIRETAERAAWIGNDETHYERKWETKDVKDLKDFIMLTLYWIESEIQYEKMKEDMPNKK